METGNKFLLFKTQTSKPAIGLPSEGCVNLQAQVSYHAYMHTAEKEVTSLELPVGNLH